MNKLIFGAFYTRNTPYADIVDSYFKQSCLELNLKFKITGIPNQGTWLKNVAEKPRVILDQLKDLKEDERLIFVDADAVIEKYPTLLEMIPPEYDFGFHLLSWKQWYGYSTDTYELLSGTLFLKNIPEVHALCLDWHRQALNYDEWEQVSLQKCLSNYKLNVYELPLEYCYPISRPGGLEPLVKLDPIISHHQKSRELKKIIRKD